jgi:hypothetical protein
MRAAIDRYVKSFININPLEVSCYYSENKEQFYSNVSYVFYLARSDDQQMLKEISSMIKRKGISQAQEKYQSDLVKVESSENELRKEIAGILKNLKEGQYRIEQFKDGSYLIYLEKKNLPVLLSLDEAKDRAYAIVWEAKFSERFNDWATELKKSAVIKDYYE